jgi:hypothetical protein
MRTYGSVRGATSNGRPYRDADPLVGLLGFLLLGEGCLSEQPSSFRSWCSQALSDLAGYTIVSDAVCVSTPSASLNALTIRPSE